MAKSVFLASSNRWNSAITEYAVSCAKAFKFLGYEPFFILKGHNAASRRIEGEGFQHQVIDDFRIPQMFKLKSLVSEKKPEVIMTFGGEETTLVNLLKDASLKKIRFRGQNFNPGMMFKFSHHLAHSTFHAVVTPSVWLNNKLKQKTKLPCHTIDLGIDTEKYKYDEDRSVKPSICLLGRFDPIKGHRHFLKIYAQMKKSWHHNHQFPVLKLIGRDENITAGMLRNWCKEFEIEDYVEIIGSKVDRIESVMNETALSVVPSLGSEVICRSTHEFLCCGCPVLVSGVGSLEESIKEGDFGFSYLGLSEEEQLNTLEIQYLTAIKETAAERQDRARRASSYFSIETMAKNLKDLISGLGSRPSQ